MSLRSNLEVDERLRLFIALRLPETTVEALITWQQDELAGAESVRILPRDHLHITLAFLGRRPASELAAIAVALRDTAARASRPALWAHRYRETAQVGMVVLVEHEPRHAHVLAGRLMLRLEDLGVYRREHRSWLPHVTVARFRKPPRLSPILPDLGTFSPSEAALYSSVLRPSGAQYEILESVAVGG